MSDRPCSIRATLEVLHCGAAMVDRAGVVVYANARLCEMLGVEPPGPIGTQAVSLLTTDYGVSRVERILEHFEEPSQGEYHLRTASGGVLHAVVAGRALSVDGGKPAYRVLTLLDITEQRESLRQVGALTDTVIEQARELKRHNAALEARVRERTAELNEANTQAVMMLAVASEARDGATGAHVRRIERLARRVGEGLGMSAPEAEHLGVSAILHDVGKIHVPDRILNKPGPLTDPEREQMQRHTLVGEAILSDTPFFAQARQIARSHHEHWDGSGYPDGLAGEASPLPARIVHVVDVFDALTHKRVYKDAWPAERARRYLAEHAGRQFDPDIVAAFEKLYEHGAVAPAVEAGHA